MSYDVADPSAARLWPYSPDWSDGFNVRRAWLTDISISRDNTEQRRALRVTKPRFSINYRSVLSGEDLRDAKLWLRSWQNKSAIVPDFARYARLASGSIATATTLEVDPMPAWAVAGQRAILCGDEDEEILIDSVAGTTITLTDPLANTWPADSVLRPTFFGLLDGRIQARRMTPGAAEIAIDLDAYPGGTPALETGSAFATLNAREIFTPDPDYSSGLGNAAIWPVEQVDKNRGWTAQFRPIDRAENLIEAEFRALDATLAGQIEQFFDRHKGRRNAFYLPTGEKDFALAGDAGSGTSTFLSTGDEIATYFGSIDYASAETAIAVCMLDGSHHYRRITDIAASGSDTLVTVDSAWPLTLTTSNVARISWMPVVRFASDEMTTSWRSPLNAQTRLSFQTVRR